MKKTAPAFQFYADDYLSSSKVQMMTLEEQGAYIRLLLFCWKDGGIPGEFSKLALLLNTTERKVKQLWLHLSPCFVISASDPSVLINERLEDVRNKQLAHSKERSESGAKGAKTKWAGHGSANGSANSSAIDQPLAKNGSPSPSPSREGNKTPVVPVNGDGVGDRFAEFWRQYPKKVGKAAALKSWKRIKPGIDLTQKILAQIADAKKSDQWHREKGQYIPNPATWLNEGRWDDEPTEIPIPVKQERIWKTSEYL